MPLIIDDEMLQTAGMTEAEARIEVACRLYDAEKLTFGQAIQWSGLRRTLFESALIDRGLPVYKITLEDLQEDMANLDKVLGKL